MSHSSLTEYRVQGVVPGYTGTGLKKGENIDALQDNDPRQSQNN